MTNPRIEYVFETELKVYRPKRCRQGTWVRKLSVNLLLVSMYGSEFDIQCVKRSLVLDKNCSTSSKDEKLKILQTNKCHGNGLIFIFCIHSLSSVVKFDKLVYTSFVVLCMSLFSMHKHILPPIREISRGAHFYVFYQI